MTDDTTKREAAKAALSKLWEAIPEEYMTLQAEEWFETIRASLATPAVPDAWLLIDSAPKNKKIILGYRNPLNNWRSVMGNWFAEGELVDHYEEPYDSEAGWYETSENSDDLPNVWPIKPTHWQPLPAAPDLLSESPIPPGNVKKGAKT